MNSAPSPVRIWLAVGLGLFSLTALLLLLRGAPSFGFKGSDEPPVVVSTGTIRPGDTLAGALSRHGLEYAFIHGIQTTLGKAFNLRRLQPGHFFEIHTSTTGTLLSFHYHVDPIRWYKIQRSTTGVYDFSEESIKTVWMEKTVRGTVSENIYKDLLKQGYDESFVANLVGDLADTIFAWRIDFFTEQRPGDEFTVLLEQEFPVGGDTPLWGGRGRILAASYVGKGTRTRENIAIRYQSPSDDRPDYYDPEGNAVRKAFLRAPFTHGAFRVSSGFNRRRLHPILRVYRPHHGTDYAASRGTPVASIGKGRVITAGWKGGYGKCVEIRHSGKYISRYGHLSSIGVKKGASVSQGQYIGRVGSTGLSTGPHLHFEMLVDGVQRNFLTMTFPAASAVAKKNMSDFNRVKDELLARLDQSLTASAPKKDASTIN